MEAAQDALQNTSERLLRWRDRRPGPAHARFSSSAGTGSFLLSAATALEMRRLFILLPFGLILGLAFYAILPDEPSVAVFALGSGAVALGVAVAILKRNVTGARWSTIALFCWFGFVMLPLHAAAFGTAMLAYPVYGDYDALVDAVIASDEGAQRAIVSGLTPIGDARTVTIRRARLVLPAGEMVQTGDHIRAALRLAPIPGPVVPGGYDSQFHSYFAGIGAYGSVTSGFERLSRDRGFNMSRWVQSLRDAIGNRLSTILGGDSAAIARAMVVGDQSAITDQLRDVMASAGLAHIYSISGLHLSIVAGGVYFLLRLALACMPALVAWPIRHIAALAGIIVAFLYLLLAGGIDNVPAFRSTLMLALVFGAVLAGRQALTMRNVAIAAMAIIVIDPASVFRASFQLSFAAVVGLIGTYEMATGRPSGRPGRLRRLANIALGTAWTSFVAGLATLLFSAYHFQQTAPLGVLGNVLALPFVSLVIMPFGVISVLAMPFGGEVPFVLAMGWGIDRMVDVAQMVARWSEGWTGNPLLAGWTLAAGVIGLGWFAFFPNRWRLVGPLAASITVLTFGFVPRPDILIADTTQAVAIRDGEGMALASGRTGSFAVDVWSDHFQTEISARHSGARCDGLGCIVTTPEYSVALVRNADAFAEDCGAHDLLIARINTPVWCSQSGAVIGPSELDRGGVRALNWNAAAGRFDIHPAIETVNRPWRAWQR